jgi:ABC-type phosphate transport system auxiliary subunit
MTNEEQLELIKLKKEKLSLQKALDDNQLHKLAMETLIEIIEKSSSEN